MPHKKIDANKPFKSWKGAAEMLIGITDDWLQPGQDRQQADMKMTRHVTLMHFKLLTTSAKNK